MLLPTGQVLFSPSIDSVQCYTPDGGPQEAWRPTISDVVRYCAAAGLDVYLLSGTQLNGLSQANMYGDDCYAATNYPLVRLRSTLTQEVYFCRTFDFSAMAVATGASLQSVRFDAANVPYGTYELCIIADGISSHGISFCHRRHGQPCGCGKTEGCCRRGADACCREEVAIDPQFIRLKEELKSVQNGVATTGLAGRRWTTGSAAKARAEADQG